MTDTDGTTSDTEGGTDGITRRQALSGVGTVAGSALLSKYATNPAQAQQAQEPRIQLGDDWDVDDVIQSDGDTDIVFRHRPTGAELVYDGQEDVLRSAETQTDAISGGVTGGNRVTNLLGDGLEYASGAVQVLSSIWDAANQVITADVDNQSVTTQTVSADEATINEQTARIYQATPQTVSSTAVTTVNFDSENPDYNPGDVLTIDLPNNKIVAEQPGRYLITGQATFNNPGDGTRVFSRLTVGTANQGDCGVGTGSDVETTASSIAIVVVTSPPTDITLEIYHNSGSGVDTVASKAKTKLDVARLG